jgi:predicted enzyme related to lactoylglutathione lyase
MTTGIQTAVGRFVWHDLNSTNVDASKGFYTKLLGWDVEVWKPGEMDYPMISANGNMHGGFGDAQGGAPSHWLGHVVVDDVDAAGKRAQSAGGSVITGPMDIPEVGRILVIRDPQGAVISAFQPAGEMPVPEGVFGWDELITNDIDAAKRFYGDLFGWTTSEMDMGGGKTYTLFQVGETSVAGGMVAEEGQETPPHWYPYLLTPNVDETTAKAKEAGATVYLEPMDVPEVGRFSVLGDPTGATFGLFQTQ